MAGTGSELKLWPALRKRTLADLTVRAFELADRYRNPAVVLADGVLGQMMEAVEFPERTASLPEKPWAVTGEADTRRNLISSIYLRHEELEAHILKLQRKYGELERHECAWEETYCNDCDTLVVAYGITSRVAREAVEMARNRGVRAGMLRPVTLYPFPTQRLGDFARTVSSVLAVELSTGQLVEDVHLAVEGRTGVRHMGRAGGMIPTAEDILEILEPPRFGCGTCPGNSSLSLCSFVILRCELEGN